MPLDRDHRERSDHESRVEPAPGGNPGHVLENLVRECGRGDAGRPQEEASTNPALPPISAETTTFASATTASGSEVVEDILLARASVLALARDLITQPPEELATHIVTEP